MKIKKHIKENKKFYVGLGTGLGVAVITTLIMRSNIVRGTMGVDGLRGGPINTASYGRYETLANSGVYGSKTADTSITMRPISFLSKQNNTVNVVPRDGRGHPGYIIRDIDSDDLFYSQRETALAKDISENLLSKHLNGKLDNVNGLHFERVSLGE